jgi:TolB-like protein/tetratricopeptide (TPR) repeat protein
MSSTTDRTSAAASSPSAHRRQAGAALKAFLTFIRSESTFQKTMIGSQLGRYRIEEQLGAGGMGVVYRAHDSRLQRDVALKLLPQRPVTDEAARRRFKREALALSRLNHPNIATVHDFDSDGTVDFLVMELIPGATPAPTRSGLPESEVLELGLQLATGLAAAHSAGVLHRDLKPANLRVTPDGRLKILDFGLAQLKQPMNRAADPETETAPVDASAVGTLPYMAPEQIEGGAFDERSDVYGAGAVLYEWLTGKRPFDGSSARLVHSILYEEPTPPRQLNDAISPGAEQIVLKAMDKDPDRRYHSAKELAVDLGRLIGSSESARAHALPAPRRRRRGLTIALSALALIAVIAGVLNWQRFRPAFGGTQVEPIAILYLQNATGDPAQEYLVEGVTRGLISQLLRISALRVTNAFSVGEYKEKPKPLATIGSELGVSKVVQGSVTPEGEGVRVALTLVDVASGERLWSQNYRAPKRDLSSTLGAAARDIAVATGVRVTAQDEERLNDKPVDPAAQEAHLRGLYAMMDGKGAEAKQYFETAIEADRTFAQPWAALASQYVQTGWFAQTLPPMQAYPKAKELALKAIALDDALAEPHVALAAIKLHHEWDWSGAEAEFKRAIELAPSSAGAHHIYAHHLLAMGRLEESVQQTRIASELDPLNPHFASCVGWHCLYARQYDEAIAQCMKVVRDKRAVALTYYYLGRVYARQGKLDEAIGALQTAVEKSGGQNSPLATLGYAYGRAGKRDEALQVLEKLQERAQKRYVSALDMAVVYAGLDDRERVFEWLDRAYLERSTWLVHVAWDDRFTHYHSDTRFPALLKRMGLPDLAPAPATKVAASR